MASLLVELHAEMEDGTEHDVVADQRDVAKWEIQDFGCPFDNIHTRPLLAYRWLAWSAMSRRGLTSLKWDEFDAQCIEVRDQDHDEEDGASGDGTLPGHTAP
ncbi:hypothetical protein [Micromonospora mirobrigensis]|uniref:Uncharacterized protein n=1 Tax=Micromonospora mirobrigensis TaxID=262898 RepID=A0A1C4XDJ5_9ACTN|nr:hypothetical protein [Micromonospora mirobrigensis]SCF06583.1 hypothetical protein GA0070564_10317 [Micromonospora mirobrigensis]